MLFLKTTFWKNVKASTHDDFHYKFGYITFKSNAS